MSWRLVIAVILLSLPGYYTLTRHERNPAQSAPESISKEFVPDFNIDQIAEAENGNNINPTKAPTQKPSPAKPSTTQQPTKSNAKNSTTTSPKSGHTAQPLQQDDPSKKKDGRVVAMSMTDFYYVAVVAGCSVAGVIGIGVAGVCWYRLQKRAKAASDVEYPAYGITGPNKDRGPTAGDRKLAQSAQMYHYQHQKQQMIAMEKANGEMKHDASEDDSEEENDEGDYTVYECPGLAPTGEMEVKNPLFNDDTPGTGGRDPGEK